MSIASDAPTDIPPQAQALIERMRAAAASGERHWFDVLLETVGLWPLAEETVGDRTYRYLIGGEAFDWLLLAERLCGELEDLAPEEEREALLMHGVFPEEVSEEEFRRSLGAPKHRAHLNFFYGVQVEEALQLQVAQEVEKERLCRVWENGHADAEVCHRIYGATRPELFERFRAEYPVDSAVLSVAELHEFTYWLFKHRVNNADPARVASDTRKGLAMLARMRPRLR